MGEVWWGRDVEVDAETWHEWDEAGFPAGERGGEWGWEDPWGGCEYTADGNGLRLWVTGLVGFNALTCPRLLFPLEGDFAKGRIREDLFYRLNVVRLSLPPLRERVEDIPLLVDHFLEKIRMRDGKEVAGFNRGALGRLCAYPWPGNVRELQNEVERCVALATPGDPIGAERLAPGIRGTDEEQERDGKGRLQQIVAGVERAFIREALGKHGGNISLTARELGVSRPGLRRKMERYGLGK